MTSQVTKMEFAVELLPICPNYTNFGVNKCHLFCDNVLLRTRGGNDDDDGDDERTRVDMTEDISYITYVRNGSSMKQTTTTSNWKAEVCAVGHTGEKSVSTMRLSNTIERLFHSLTLSLFVFPALIALCQWVRVLYAQAHTDADFDASHQSE